ncbi:MAG: hypothetical protein DDT32_01787 [Syntrophomonadaceae bacterium]|nr:hypothetical protein [Bacillota bacterium]
MTIIPAPPTNCIKARQNKKIDGISCGKASIVNPVVVHPLVDSNKESNSGNIPERKNGSAPSTIAMSQMRITIREASAAVKAGCFLLRNPYQRRKPPMMAINAGVKKLMV